MFIVSVNDNAFNIFTVSLSCKKPYNLLGDEYLFLLYGCRQLGYSV